MADIRGIELASEIYGLEDTSARNTATAASQTATQASQTATQAGQTATQASETATQASETATQADSKIGNLADLKTDVKTNVVSAINETLTTKSVSDATLTPVQEVTAATLSITSMSRSGNVISGLIIINNIDGTNIGTQTIQIIAQTSLKPAKLSCAMGLDFISNKTVWLEWRVNGDIGLSGTSGVTKGNNAIRIPFTIIV